MNFTVKIINQFDFGLQWRHISIPIATVWRMVGSLVKKIPPISENYAWIYELRFLPWGLCGYYFGSSDKNNFSAIINKAKK